MIKFDTGYKFKADLKTFNYFAALGFSHLDWLANFITLLSYLSSE